MATNHDQLMKELIATFPDQFLHLAAPEVAARIDPGSLAFEPEEHFSGNPTGHARRCDLVSRATVLPPAEGSGGEDEVLMHVEIELNNRAAVPPKLLLYNRGLSLKHALPVHTIVLFLHGGPAGSQVRIYEEHSLGRTVGTLTYHSLGLSQALASEYLARPEPLAWAFAALMRPAKGQRRSQLGLECVHRIANEPSLSPDHRRLLLGWVLTYADLEDDDAEEFDRIVAELEDEEVQDVRMSMTERWRRQGLEQGKKEGKAEGRMEGKAEGRMEGKAEGVRELLVRLLGQRFGSVSSEVLGRIGAMTSVEELSGLAERVYQVDSLDELGLA